MLPRPALVLSLPLAVVGALVMGCEPSVGLDSVAACETTTLLAVVVPSDSFAYVRSSTTIAPETEIGRVYNGDRLEAIGGTAPGTNNQHQWFPIRWGDGQGFVAASVVMPVTAEVCDDLAERVVMLDRDAAILNELDEVFPAGSLFEIVDCASLGEVGCTVTAGLDRDGDGIHDVFSLRQSIDAPGLLLGGVGTRTDLDVCPSGWAKLAYSNGVTVDSDEGADTGVVPLAGAMRLRQLATEEERFHRVELAIPASAEATTPAIITGLVPTREVDVVLDRCAPWGPAAVEALGPARRVAFAQWQPKYGGYPNSQDLFRLRNLSSALRNLDGRELTVSADSEARATCNNSFECAVCQNLRADDYVSDCFDSFEDLCAPDYVCDGLYDQCRPFHAAAFDSGDGSRSLGGGADIAVHLLNEAIGTVVPEANLPDQLTTSEMFQGQLEYVCTDSFGGQVGSFSMPESLPPGLFVVSGTRLLHADWVLTSRDLLSTVAFVELWERLPPEQGDP